MSSSQRQGHGAVVRMCGPKTDKNVPMGLMQLNHLINAFVEPKPRNHQGPPKSLVGTGGFHITRRRAK